MTVYFALLGPAQVKAARKMLVKLTPALQPQSPNLFRSFPVLQYTVKLEYDDDHNYNEFILITHKNMPI